MDKKESKISIEQVEQLIQVLSPVPETWIVVVAIAAVLSAFEVTFSDKGVAVAFRLTAITVALIGLVWLPFLLRLIALTGGGLKTAAGEASVTGLIELIRVLDPGTQRQALPPLIAALDEAEAEADATQQPQVREARQGLENQLRSVSQDVKDAREQIERYAREYEALRRDMSKGAERTRKMNLLTAQIRALADAARYTPAEIIAMFNRDTPGDRIAALTLARAIPDSALLDVVLRGIGESRSAFEQYQALQAAEDMAPALDANQKRKLKTVVDDQRSGAPGKWLTPDNRNRRAISNRILKAL